MISGRAAVRLALGVAGVAIAAPALTGGSPYPLHVLTVAGCFALLAIGYQFIFGHAGALALSQGSFMGVGAYVAGLLAARSGIGLAAALPAASAAAGLLALLVAIPVLRLATHYFALATLILAQLLLLLATQWEGLTGGANGIGGIAPLAPLPGFAIAWGAVALGGLLAWRIGGLRLGAAYALIRRDRAATAACGIDAGRLRLLAFFLSAIYAGIAGALYAHVLGVISPDILGFPVMVTCLTIVVVGSPRRVGGAIAGAVLVVELPEWFRGFRDWYLVAYGAALLLAVIALPGGIIGAAETLAERLRPARTHAPPRPLALAPVRRHAPDPLLRVEAVSRSFGGVRALDQVSCRVAPGEVVGVIGPNGSGKSTLLNVISGQLRPDAGHVMFAGVPTSNLLPHRIARLGLARGFQTPLLAEKLSALDNVAVALRPDLLGPRAALLSGNADLRRARAEAMGLLAGLGLEAAALLPARTLAAGSRRLVEIARALAAQPLLLLLDEPAAGLGAEERTTLTHRLRGLAADGVALMVVEHNIPFLSELATTMICLDRGRLIAAGPPTTLRSSPAVLSAYLGDT